MLPMADRALGAFAKTAYADSTHVLVCSRAPLQTLTNYVLLACVPISHPLMPIMPMSHICALSFIVAILQAPPSTHAQVAQGSALLFQHVTLLSMYHAHIHDVDNHSRHSCDGETPLWQVMLPWCTQGFLLVRLVHCTHALIVITGMLVSHDFLVEDVLNTRCRVKP